MIRFRSNQSNRSVLSDFENTDFNNITQKVCIIISNRMSLNLIRRTLKYNARLYFLSSFVSQSCINLSITVLILILLNSTVIIPFSSSIVYRNNPDCAKPQSKTSLIPCDNISNIVKTQPKAQNPSSHIRDVSRPVFQSCAPLITNYALHYFGMKIYLAIIEVLEKIKENF